MIAIICLCFVTVGCVSCFLGGYLFIVTDKRDLLGSITVILGGHALVQIGIALSVHINRAVV